MRWHGPQTGECSCCGTCETDEDEQAICLDPDATYPTMELEIPPWGSSSGCVDCENAISGTFVLQEQIVGTDRKWVYTDNDALPDCVCGTFERLRLDFQIEISNNHPLQVNCCFWIARLRFVEVGVLGALGNATRSFDYRLDVTKTYRPGDRLTFTTPATEQQLGNACACDLSTPPSYVRLHL